MKFLVSVFILCLILLVPAGQVLASEQRRFISCINPAGEIKANYEDGTHGIVGSTNTYVGKDTVYSLSGDALTQCFCSSDGKGIQTNWWKISSLTQNEINGLISQGWHYVPNGALWGLDPAPYLAFNSEYICKSTERPGEFSPTTDIPGPGGSGGQGGSVAGISTGIGQVLGLASTGNTKFMYVVFSISIFSLLSGLYLKKRTKKVSR